MEFFSETFYPSFCSFLGFLNQLPNRRQTHSLLATRKSLLPTTEYDYTLQTNALINSDEIVILQTKRVYDYRQTSFERRVYTWYTWMRFQSRFLNQFQAKRINTHWCASARLHYSICTQSGCSPQQSAFCCRAYREGKVQSAKYLWRNALAGSTPTQVRFMEKVLVKTEQHTLCQNARVIWEKFFKVYCCALL